MSGVGKHVVAVDEAGLRLDRWFQRHFPSLPHARLQALLRGGQVRLDGRRAKANDRLVAGQTIRVPPLEEKPPVARPAGPPPAELARDIAELQRRVLYRDDEVLIIDKPAGLATQGGSKTFRHLDACLDGLALGGERPRLVHRLDKDTSGTLVLARTVAAAARLGEAFRRQRVRKLYWALTLGRSSAASGRIDLPLARAGGAGRERIVVDREAGQPATTCFRELDHAGEAFAWLELEPLTGRTHQLRVHCVALGAPIVGDGKYGGRGGADLLPDAGRLHLHARAVTLPLADGETLTCVAPLPPHMRRSFRVLGFATPD